MRKLNVKVLIIFLGTLLIVGAGVGAVLYLKSDKSSEYLAAAREADKQGDYDTAVENYQRYLAENTTDQEIICEAAIVGSHCLDEEHIEDSKKKRAAYMLMARALRGSPGRNDIRRNYVDGLVALGELSSGSEVERSFFIEAEKELKKLSSQQKEDPEVDYLYAQCAEKLERHTTAIEKLSGLVGYEPKLQKFDDENAKAPHMIKAYTLLADLFRRRGTGGRDDEKIADIMIDRMVALNPENAEAFVSRGIYTRRLTQSESSNKPDRRKALDDFLRARELDPGNMDTLINVVDEYIYWMDKVDNSQREDYAALARDDLASAREIDSKDFRIYVRESRLARQLENREEELAAIEEGLEIIPSNGTLVNLLFNAQLEKKQSEEAKQTIEKMKGLNFRPEWIAFSEAKVLCIDEQWLEASTKLEALRPRMSFSPNVIYSLDHLLGRCYKALGQPDRQIEVYGRTLAERPESRIALAGQAEALVALKRMPEALEKLTPLKNVMGAEDFDSDEGLRSLYLATLASLSQKNSEYRNRLEGVKQEYVTREDVAGSDKAVVETESLIRSDRIEEAFDRLNEALIEFPDAARLQNTYLALMVREQGAEAALEYLKTATTRDENPWTDRPELFLRQAELIVLAGGPEQAKKVKALEKEILNYEENDQGKLWKKIARIYYQLTPSRREDARRCLRTAGEKDADQVYTIGLFELAREAENELEMQAQVDEAANRFGKNTPVPQFLEARYLLWKYQQDPVKGKRMRLVQTADRLADQIAKKRPKWQRLLELKGSIQELQGDFNAAIDFYQESIDAGPLDALTVRHLVELLVQQGQYDEARKVLLRLNNVPQSLKKEQLTLDLLTGNREAALTSLNQAAPVDSKNAEDWVRRGRVLLRLGKIGEAETAFRRAVQLAPQLPQPSLALVEYLLQTQRTKEAEIEIRNIENRLSQDVAAQVMAQCYAWLGNRMMAEHYLAAAIANNPADMERERAMAKYHMINNRLPRAIPHLNTILENSLESEGSPSEISFWARRSLARVFASLRTHRFFEQALALVEGNRQEGDLKSPDLNLKGLILAVRPEPIYRQKAIEILQNIPRKDLEPEERLALGQLYYISDQWPECRETMQALLVDYPEDTRFLVKYVEMLIDKQEWRTLGPWMRQLQRRDPKGRETIRLTAKNAKGRGKDRPAIAAIESFIPDGVERADERKVLAAAALYEEMGLDEQAEAAYRAVADRDFGYRINLAAFLSRQGQLDEAYRICDAIVNKEILLEICAIGIGGAVRHANTVTDEEIKQVKRWIALAKKEYPNSVDLVTQQAALFSAIASTRNATDSKDSYRQALKLIQAVPAGKMDENQRGLLANNLAYMTVKTGGDFEVARENIDLAFKLLGPRIELLDTRAIIHIEEGEYDQAIEDLNEATLFDVSSGVYYFHLALAHQGKDDRDAALAALEKAEELKFTGEKIDGIDREKYLKLKRWLQL